MRDKTMYQLAYPENNSTVAWAIKKVSLTDSVSETFIIHLLQQRPVIHSVLTNMPKLAAAAVLGRFVEVTAITGNVNSYRVRHAVHDGRDIKYVNSYYSK